MKQQESRDEQIFIDGLLAQIAEQGKGTERFLDDMNAIERLLDDMNSIERLMDELDSIAKLTAERDRLREALRKAVEWMRESCSGDEYIVDNWYTDARAALKEVGE